jgi:hypothetical protein
MKKLALISALLLAASPVAAQVAVSNGQQQTRGQIGPSATTQAPTTGVFCIEEMTATFCNVLTGPNTSGYGSRGGVHIEQRVRIQWRVRIEQRCWWRH